MWDCILCGLACHEEGVAAGTTNEIFMIQNGIGHSVVSADSLETIWKQWHPWRRLMDINIQPCLDLDETVSLFKKEKMNTRMD